MKNNCILILTCLLLGCHSRLNLIKFDKVASIKLFSYDGSVEQYRGTISSKDSLRLIVDKLNDCNKEPIQFLTNIKLEVLNTDNSEDDFLFSGSSMKFKGQTYRLKYNIHEITGL